MSEPQPLEKRAPAKAPAVSAPEDKAEKPQHAPAKLDVHNLKTPKGTRDYGPEETRVREEVLAKIVKVFKLHGAVSIETPVFELKEVLVGQYGEDEKLIYDLEYQGGELCSLRYDLTVPFSRFVAQNNIKQIKKYQIGRVYRRDQPQMNRGRYREFYQCDFDIAGAEYGHMLPDAECVAIMSEILQTLAVGPFVVKINHRGLLDGIFAVAGVPAALFVPICSAVDKLDKEEWSTVRAEMIAKGLDATAADAIHSFITIRGDSNEATLEKLMAHEKLVANAAAKDAIADLKLLCQYLTWFGVPSDNYAVDLTLARGLSYYTGTIYETVLKGANVGSVGGGGRYDKLVGRFKKKGDIPCVGLSIGVERLFTVMMEQQKAANAAAKASSTQVLVCAIDPTLLQARMQLVRELWDRGVCAELLLKEAPKIQAQLKYAESNQIPFALIIGSDELRDGTVKLKDLATGEQKQLPRAEAVAWLAALKQ